MSTFMRGRKTWAGTLRVCADAGEPSSQWLTYSTRAWNCPPTGCDHHVVAETRAKAHAIAVRQHKDCVEERAAEVTS